MTITLTIIGAITLYVVCGVLAYGLTLAYFQQKWPEIRDTADRYGALFVAACGPAGLLVALLGSERLRYGFQWRAEDGDWAKDRRKYRDSTL